MVAIVMLRLNSCKLHINLCRSNKLKLSQEVFEKFKRYSKITEYFGKISSANENYQLVRMNELTSVRVNASIENVPIDVDHQVDAVDAVDFRMIDIIPTSSDIVGEAPFIEKIILNGKYDKIDHYLDVSFGAGKSCPESSNFINMLSNEARPPFNDLHMDQCQYEAYFGALTKQLAIIQGPPGELTSFTSIL